MKNIQHLKSLYKIILVVGCLFSSMGAFAQNDTVVATQAYAWIGDTIFQDEFKAWTESPYMIKSTYKGRPGYFMPVLPTWAKKNDITPYPAVSGGNPLMNAVYNMGLDEMVNAVEPDTTLRTGKEWAGVWTRDVSYSIILSMAALQPQASMISLLKKVNDQGQIIQDTGSGGAWPISTDRMIWTVAAWEIYKVTGDRQWLETVYPVVVNSLLKDAAVIISDRGLIKGETSFIDWREQSYPRWMQTVDISQSEAFGTNVLYAVALKCASQMAQELDHPVEAYDFSLAASLLADRIDKIFWMPDKGYHAMYTYGRDNNILNPRAETLGESLSILFDIAPADRQRSASQNMPLTKFGPPIFYPQISDIPNYHNNALWPFVASYWTLAQAKVGNEQGVLEGIGSVLRPAALFATNKENLNLDNGDYYTELNSSNMLWSLSGNIALTQQILFGIHFEKDGLRIAPFVPQALGADRTLSNFPYRGARISITVKGFGDKVKTLTVNGKEFTGDVIPASMITDGTSITAVMDNKPIPPMQLNKVDNLKAPLTPVAWLSNSEDLNAPSVPVNNLLQWNPIEYIAQYIILKDGEEVARTRQTSWPAIEEGFWQVIGVAADGTQSFASEPRSNRSAKFMNMDGEKTIMSSTEVSYPVQSIQGYRGDGFVETDHTLPTPEVKFHIEKPGMYLLSFRYANGNGPVNTENKAAVRSLMVDGKDVGTIVLPQRGVANWDDWGWSNAIPVEISAGPHTARLILNPEDENMNLHTNHALIDGLLIERK